MGHCPDAREFRHRGVEFVDWHLTFAATANYGSIRCFPKTFGLMQ